MRVLQRSVTCCPNRRNMNFGGNFRTPLARRFPSHYLPAQTVQCIDAMAAAVPLLPLAGLGAAQDPAVVTEIFRPSSSSRRLSRSWSSVPNVDSDDSDYTSPRECRSTGLTPRKRLSASLKLAKDAITPRQRLAIPNLAIYNGSDRVEEVLSRLFPGFPAAMLKCMVRREERNAEAVLEQLLYHGWSMDETWMQYHEEQESIRFHGDVLYYHGIAGLDTRALIAQQPPGAYLTAFEAATRYTGYVVYFQKPDGKLGRKKFSGPVMSAASAKKLGARYPIARPVERNVCSACALNGPCRGSIRSTGSLSQSARDHKNEKRPYVVCSPHHYLATAKPPSMREVRGRPRSVSSNDMRDLPKGSSKGGSLSARGAPVRSVSASLANVPRADPERPPSRRTRKGSLVNIGADENQVRDRPKRKRSLSGFLPVKKWSERRPGPLRSRFANN